MIDNSLTQLKRPLPTTRRPDVYGKPPWLAEPMLETYIVNQGLNVADDVVAAVDGKVFLPSGSVLGQTALEALAGEPLELASAGDEVLYLTMEDAQDVPTTYIGGFKKGIQIHHDRLPNWEGLAAEVQALVVQHFTCSPSRSEPHVQII